MINLTTEMKSQNFQKRIDKAKLIGDVTDNDVAYEYDIFGQDGAHFYLLKESHHTQEQLKIAKSQIRRDHDVMSIHTKTDNEN